MKANLALACLLVFANSELCGSVLGQEPSRQQPEPRSPRRDGEGRGRPIFGKILAIGGDSIEVTGPDGNKVTLKLTSSTDFRKDRQPAKRTDFKVGDTVVIRTDQADGKGGTALMVATGQFAMRGGQGGPGGAGGFAGGMSGTLGKDFVIGEVKSIDPPRLTVIRTDNVSQALELNEETSLRRGRESITMADIQAGDHVVARGAVGNNVFVPRNLTVFSPDEWKRIEEMMSGSGPGSRSAPTTPASPNAPAAPNAPTNPPNPPEPQN